jgi:hypothetical protein
VKLFRVDYQGAPRYAISENDGDGEGVMKLVEGDVFAGPPFRTGAAISPGRILSPVTPSKVANMAYGIERLRNVYRPRR